MKLTKFEHACLLLESSTDRLIIDPGMFSTSLGDLVDVAAIVITHEHGDHWTPDQLGRILDKNPEAKIFAPAGVALAATGFDITVVDGGDTATAGTFELEFFGTTHAVIHSSLPIVDNVGVLVNGTLYYPGDSFTEPPAGTDVVAVPAGAPWLKIGEVIDYVLAVKPKRSFPAHEMVLSTAGKGMANDRIKNATEAGGGVFFPLEPGDTLEL